MRQEPKLGIERWHARQENVLQELLDKVDVCHDHAPTAVTFATKLIQRVSNHLVSGSNSSVVSNIGIPVSEPFLLDDLDKLLPEVTRHLE